MAIRFDLEIAGLNFFETATLILFAILFILFITQSFEKNNYNFTIVDVAILSFVFWCTVILPFGLGSIDYKSYVKWIVPPLTYILLRKSFRSFFQYTTCLKLMIFGCAIPIIGSAIAIMLGFGPEKVNFWTGMTRHAGLYSGSHSLGHSAGFFLLALVAYLYMCNKKWKIKHSLCVRFLFSVVVLAAIYCLMKSHVRTVLIGLLIFALYVTYIYNKKALILGALIIGVAAIMMTPILYLLFFDVIDAASGNKPFHDAGSGRPFIWEHNINVFSELPIEQQLIGVGIGNIVVNTNEDTVYSDTKISTSNVWNSHNDFLETMMQTGIIGLILQLFIHLSLFNIMIKSNQTYKHIYIGAFIAITFMNIASNSYISRFGLSQMFYMYFACFAIPDRCIEEV